MTTTKRAAIYTRLSSDPTGEAKGVQRQEEACRALAIQRGWEIAAVIVENDTSATRGRRPKYEQMLADARAGQFDVIVAWAVDRLTRSPREVEDLIDLAEQTDVLIVTAAGDLDLSTDAGRLVGRILGSVARGEIERKRARMIARNRQHAADGHPPAKRAFGYRADGTTDEVEAAIVRDVFTRYAAGAGAKTLARELNDRGIVNTRNEPWTPTGIVWMLANRRYLAERTLNGELVGPGNWAPIVDADLFAAVGARLDANANSRNAGNNRRHLGAGLYVCGVDDCGRTVKSFWKTSHLADGSVVNRLRYTCQPVRHLVRAAPDVDAYVIGAVVAYLRHHDVGRLLTDQKDAELVTGLRREAIGLQGSLRALEASMSLPIDHDEYISPAMAGRAEKRVQGRLREIEVQLAQAGERSALALLSSANDPGEAWRLLAQRDIRAAREVVRAVCTVTLLPGKPGRSRFDPSSVRITWM